MIAALAFAFAAAMPQSRDSSTVVFVCEHGTVKSVVALAFFRKLAAERHLPVRAISRGTNLEPAVPDRVRNGLGADFSALGAFVPTALTDDDLKRASMVISFDRPAVYDRAKQLTRAVAWDNLPAVSENYAVAADSIRARVKQLVDSLDRARKRR